MNTTEIITICISFLSFLLSFFSMVFSVSNMAKIERISYGEFELSIRQTITLAKNNVVTAIQKATDNNSYDDQIVKFTVEELLNTYEEVCAKYIDKKLDRKRFKEMYCNEIKNVVESNTLKTFFQSDSKYDATKKVYDEWFIPKK